MATLLSDQYNLPVPCGPMVVLYGEKTFTVAPSAADVIKMFKIPVGFTPLFGYLHGDDIDTGTETLEIDVGITGSAQKYLNSGVLTGDAVSGVNITTGIRIALQESLLTDPAAAFTSETDCIATITAAANAGGTGTIKVILCGVFNDPRF